MTYEKPTWQTRAPGDVFSSPHYWTVELKKKTAPSRFVVVLSAGGFHPSCLHLSSGRFGSSVRVRCVRAEELTFG